MGPDLSTHWELECVDCGAKTDWGQSGATNHIDVMLVELCETGAIQGISAAAQDFDLYDGTVEWSVSIHRAFSPNDLNIHLPGVFQNCAGHKIWPRNEYGDWAKGGPVVVASPPMANDRDPADPSKPAPYWQTAAPKPVAPEPKPTPSDVRTFESSPKPVVVADDSARVVDDFVGQLETRVHDLRSAIANVSGISMVGKTDIELCESMLAYVRNIRLGAYAPNKPPLEPGRNIDGSAYQTDAAENASFEERANSAVEGLELDPRDTD